MKLLETTFILPTLGTRRRR
ncbi:hypothetical protein TSAR_016884 [Trichomalopsis sarcophagae]|uniref:Uncharacterized protein n=1 Tax=Trichomalopsis sarcophagae TaxID=543379 RepID=A0A232EII7_9HYME|nr:hypothetical protein TSAR_016884 [Trichomalopsis sarcophagae]